MCRPTPVQGRKVRDGWMNEATRMEPLKADRGSRALPPMLPKIGPPCPRDKRRGGVCRGSTPAVQ